MYSRNGKNYLTSMKRIKPRDGNKTFCMAPWTHTYMSPQMERRLCCSSLEESTNFKQYIDSDGPKGDNNLGLHSLEQHWNSDYMKGIRKDLMAGKEIPQCAVCNHKLLNAQVYRQHFNRMYSPQVDEAFEKTDDDGHTDMNVSSFDYRFSNLCSFSCRMCGDMLSSSWESENRKNGVDYETKNLWGRKDIKEQLKQFHDQQVVKEFMEAVENKTVKEFYWCGGEPLMWKIHWEAMQRVIDLGYSDSVLARYNSNMSRIDYYGKNLFEDILSKFKYWQINASIDGTGEIGEYIRTGLDYKSWLKNMRHAKKYAKNPRDLQLDLTVPLPGLFDLENMHELSKDLKVPLLCKKVFSFSSDNLMSPLALPRELLEEIVTGVQDRFTDKPSVFNMAYIEGLKDLKNHKTYQEKYGEEEYRSGLKKGKARLEYLDKIRGTDITKILAKNKKVLDWWTSI